MYQLQRRGLVLQRLQRLQALLGQQGRPGVVQGLALLFGRILHKDVKNISVALSMDKMPVVLNPPDDAVLAHNAVFHVVQVVVVRADLPPDAFLHFIQVIRMHHPRKGIPGVRLKFL